MMTRLFLWNHNSRSLDSQPAFRPFNPHIPSSFTPLAARNLAQRNDHALINIQRSVVAVRKALHEEVLAEMVGQHAQHQGEGEGSVDEEGAMAVDGAGVERIEMDGVGVEGQSGEVEEVGWRGCEGDGVRSRVRVC
jgi:hypothetical protein